MDRNLSSIAPKLLSLDIDESQISSILPSLISSSTGIPVVSETSIERLVQFERSGDADALVNETRKVLSALNTQLHHQQVIYELTIKDILMEVKRLRITVRHRDEEINSKVSIIDDLHHQVREYQRLITGHEQTISNLTIQVRQYEDQIHQFRFDLEQKMTHIQNLEAEAKNLQTFKIQFLAVDVERNSFDNIKKTLLAENLNLRKWKTELEAKITSLEQLKYQLSIDFVKLTETVLDNAKVPQPGNEELLLKGRLIAEKENAALLQHHVEGLLSRTKDLETQIVDLKQKNKRLTDELHLEGQRHEEATKSISELSQKVYEQSKTISVLSKQPDTTTTTNKKVSTSEESALKVLSEKLHILSVDHGSTLKSLEELQKEVETVRTDRDAAYSAMERYSVSLAEIRKFVIERINVSFNTVTVPPPVPNLPVTPPKPRVPMSDIAEQAKRYHELLNSPPSKKRKD